MRYITNKKLSAIMVLMLFYGLGNQLGFPVTSRLSEESFRVVWDKRYGDERLWNEYRAMALGKNGETLIAASARNAPDASDSNVNRLLLWKIDQKGEITSETEIRKPQGSGKSSASAAIKDLAVLENGDTLLIVDFEGAHPSIVRVDRTGKQSLTKNITGPDRQISLFKMVPTSDGKFLLLGHESLDAFAMEIDATGNILWERKVDRGKMDLFVDGIATPEGGFILVGNSGQYDILRGGPSDVWVSRYDANGREKAEVSFQGRYGRVARSQDGGYGVVYDKGTSDGQDIRLRLLDPELKELWESPLLTVTPGFLDFKIAAVPGGGFIVAGAKGGKPYVIRVDAKGESLGTFQSDANMSIEVGSYGLIQKGGEILVCSSIIDISVKTSVTRKVRMMRIIL